VKKIFLVYFSSLICLMLNGAVFGQTSSEPPSDPNTPCSQEGFVFKNNQIYFNNDTNAAHRIFLIHNITPTPVVLNKLDNTGAMGSGGWTSRLDGNQWSALAMSQPNLNLSCESFNPPFYRLMDCKNGLSVCTYHAKNNTGSFWIVENTSLLNVLKTLKQRNMID
jgi:hypothetical protein